METLKLDDIKVVKDMEIVPETSMAEVLGGKTLLLKKKTRGNCQYTCYYSCSQVIDTSHIAKPVVVFKIRKKK